MRTSSGPVWIGQVELGRSSLPSGAVRDRRPDDLSARLLVRLHGQVLGFVSIPLTTGPFTTGARAELAGQAVCAAVRSQLGPALVRHLRVDGLRSEDDQAWISGAAWARCHQPSHPASTPAVSVVVCTRDRPEMLGPCLERLQELEYASFEVVVVDNAPSTKASLDCFARTVGDDPRFRYVLEAVPGLSRARNRGMAEATARYVAFTDDDVRVDRWWLQGIAAGFGRDQTVACVTGLVPPAELDHPAQHYFDRRFSWNDRLDAHVYSLDCRDGLSPLYPYSAGLFGTGANFAVDRDLMEGLGGFDEALGAGTPAGGGEELDAFVRVLRAGRSLAYEPSAVVWHFHRHDARALRRQLFSYGVGLTAFLTKYLVDTGTTREILRRIPDGVHRLLRMWSPTAMHGRRAPTRLVLTEAFGMVAGPLAYARGRRRGRRPSIGA
jgi:GT2 family glycosyltransferase